MDQESREILYLQLIQMEEDNINDEPILTEEEFMALSDRDAIKYVFEYRDYKFDTIIPEESRVFIELPDIDLEGQDLSGVYLSDFFPSYEDEKGVTHPSKVNLRNTGATINLNMIGYTEDTNSIRKILDFEDIDFRGCELQGRLPIYSGNVKYIKVENANEEHLDSRYLERIKQKDAYSEGLNDRVFTRLLNGENFYKLKGIAGICEIDLRDYDFNQMDDEQIIDSIIVLWEEFKERENILKIYINDEIIKRMYEKKRFDVAVLAFEFVSSELQEKLIKDENILDAAKLILEKRKKELKTQSKADIDYLPNAIKNAMVYSEYEKGNLELAKYYMSYLSNEVLDKIIYAEYQKGNIKLFLDEDYLASQDLIETIVKSEYEKGNLEFAKKYVYKISAKFIEEMVKTEYEKGNLEFVSEWRFQVSTKFIEEIVKTEYEKGNLDFVREFRYKVSTKFIEEMVKTECEKGNLEFVSEWRSQVSTKFIEEMVKTEYEKGNLEFFRIYESQLSDKFIEEMAKTEYEKGNLEFVRECKYRLSDKFIGTTIKTEYEKGNLEFVEYFIKEGPKELKESIIKTEYEKGNLEFVEKIIKGASKGLQEGIVKTEYEKGNLEFVTQYMYLMPDDFKENVIRLEYEKGNLEFVEKHLHYAPKQLQEDIVDREKEKGNKEFANKWLKYGSVGTKETIISEEYKNGNLEFVENHFFLITEKLQEEIIMTELEKGNLELINKYFNAVSLRVRDKIVLKEYEKEDFEFVMSKFDLCSRVLRRQIIAEEVEKENAEIMYRDNRLITVWGKKSPLFSGKVMYISTKKDMIVEMFMRQYEKGKFIKKVWDVCPSELKEEITIKEAKQGNFSLLNEEWLKIGNFNRYECLTCGIITDEIAKIITEEENRREKEQFGGKKKAFRGAALYDAISSNYNIKTIEKLIKYSNLEYEEYENEKVYHNDKVLTTKVTYTSLLYTTMQMIDGAKRKEVLTLLLKKGIDINKGKTIINYHNDSRVFRKTESCLEMRGRELRNLIVELKEKGELSDESYPDIVPSKEKRNTPEKIHEDIDNFFKKEMELSEEQYNQLKQEFSKRKMDIYYFFRDASTLNIRKFIFETCGIAKKDFCNLQCLTQDPRVLYARARFFKDIQKNIRTDRPITNIAMSKLSFASNYGAEILGEEAKPGDQSYADRVRKRLIEEYPMPREIDELKMGLKENIKEV